MSNFQRYTGYIYPLPQMTDEERFEYLGKVNEEATFDLDADKFMTEQLGDNKYLLWVTSSSYGKESGAFGLCRPCNQQEIYYHAPKFRKILGEIDTKKLKFIEFCYYNSTECTVDYYLGEEEYKPMTLDEAIQHCKDVAASKCDECGKEHTQLAEWLQELKDYKDETQITKKWLLDNGFYENGERFYKTDGKPFYYGIEARYIVNDVHKSYHFSFSRRHYPMYEATFKTVGQFKMFMTLCGLEDFVKQLK